MTRARTVRLSIGTAAFLMISYSSVTITKASCYGLVERIYDQCIASCDMNVDRTLESFGKSTWGAINQFNNQMAQDTFRRALDNGILSESQMDAYQANVDNLNNFARDFSVGDCRSHCLDERFELESAC